MMQWRKVANWMWMAMLAMMLTACLGGGAGETAGSSGSGTGQAGTPTVQLVLVAALPASGSNAISKVNSGTPIYAVATVKDGRGAPLANTLVSFVAKDAFVRFSPASAQVATDSTGVASIQVDAVGSDSLGSTAITATVQISSKAADGTISTQSHASLPVAVDVNTSRVTLGTLSFGQASISSYGTTVVSVPVQLEGAPAGPQVSVSFSSPCISSGKATIDSPVNVLNGVATTTYRDQNCASGTDVVTATASGASSSGTLAVTLPAANNLQFVSVAPTLIGIQGAGSLLPQTATVKFRVIDTNGNGRQGVSVDFSLLPSNGTGGATLFPSTATSDALGEVLTTVSAGTIPTPVSVRASLGGTTGIVSQSSQLSVSTGLPAQNGFSLALETGNIEGWLYDGVSTALTVTASDRMGNPAPDGTAINFIAEGGQISPSCTLSSGRCSVSFRSAQYRPQGELTSAQSQGAVAAVDSSGAAITDSSGNPLFVQNGRVTVLAYAVGEMSFLDANGNNVFDAGETFYDLGDPFVDANENGKWDSSPVQPDLREQYLSFAPVSSPVACLTRNVNGGTAALPANYANALSRENTCGGAWGKAYVRRSRVIVLSDSYPKLSQTSFAMSSACTRTFGFWLMDRNNNPMPSGTQVSIGTNTVTFTEPASTPSAATVAIGSGSPVGDTTHAGGSWVTMTVDGGTNCTGTGSYPSGPVEILTKTPLGGQASVNVTVN